MSGPRRARPSTQLARCVPRTITMDSVSWRTRPAPGLQPRRQRPAAFTPASVLGGHPLFRNTFKNLADAVIFARFVEKKVGAERKAFGAVLGERVVGEDNHLRLGCPMRDE